MDKCKDKCNAVLLDSVSIQRYIFQSNRLKDNIGASYLVDDIYKTLLARSLGVKIEHLCGWKKAFSNKPELSDDKPFSVGYIGGGNALLFFFKESLAEQFITA